jgi:hypothetical protein
VARRPAKRTSGRPWRPPALTGFSAARLNRLSYVVVEEWVEPMIGLLVSAWPRSGANGQPVFDEAAGEEEVTVDREPLQRRLSQRQVPESFDLGGGARAARRALRHRQVEVGDVFALRLAGEGDPQEVVDEIGVARWIEEAVDITPEGRESAKAATYAALTPPLSRAVVRALRRKRDEGER